MQPGQVHDVAKILGYRWAPAVLIGLQAGPSRYSELANRVHRLDSGISEKALTHTLRRLAEHGLVDRASSPSGYALYSLTSTGERVVPWLESFAELVAGATRGAGTGSVPPAPEAGRWGGRSG